MSAVKTGIEIVIGPHRPHHGPVVGRLQLEDRRAWEAVVSDKTWRPDPLFKPWRHALARAPGEGKEAFVPAPKTEYGLRLARVPRHVEAPIQWRPHVTILDVDKCVQTTMRDLWFAVGQKNAGMRTLEVSLIPEYRDVLRACGWDVQLTHTRR